MPVTRLEATRRPTRNPVLPLSVRACPSAHTKLVTESIISDHNIIHRNREKFHASVGAASRSTARHFTRV
jgi:hypothetical protein